MWTENRVPLFLIPLTVIMLIRRGSWLSQESKSRAARCLMAVCGPVPFPPRVCFLALRLPGNWRKQPEN